MVREKIITFGVVFALILGTMTPSFANAEKNSQEAATGELIKTVQEAGISVASPIEKRSLGFHKIRTVLSREVKKHKGCGWLYDVWAKRNAYKFSVGRGFAIGFAYKGFNLTLGFESTREENIHVDYPKKYSKLGAYADVTLETVKYTYYQGGAVYKTEKKVEAVKYANRTYDVVYKK